MACNTLTLSGIAKDCLSNMGGISEVLIANYSDVSSVSAESGKITAIQAAGKFKRYEFRRNTGSLTSNYTLDASTGNRFVTSDLVLQFSRMETTKRVEITALATNDLAVIVKDANGIYFYLGKDEPVTASAGDGQTGTARSDANRYTITLQDISQEMPFEVADSIIADLIG